MGLCLDERERQTGGGGGGVEQGEEVEGKRGGGGGGAKPVAQTGAFSFCGPCRRTMTQDTDSHQLNESRGVIQETASWSHNESLILTASKQRTVVVTPVGACELPALDCGVARALIADSTDCVIVVHRRTTDKFNCCAEVRYIQRQH